MSEPTDADRVPLTPPNGTPRFPAFPDLPPLPDFPGPTPTIPIPAPRVTVDLPRPSPTVTVEPPPRPATGPMPAAPPRQLEPVALTAAEPPRPAPEGRWVREALGIALRPTRPKAAGVVAAAALVGGALGLQVVFSQSHAPASNAAPAKPAEKHPPAPAEPPPSQPTADAALTPIDGTLGGVVGGAPAQVAPSPPVTPEPASGGSPVTPPAVVASFPIPTPVPAPAPAPIAVAPLPSVVQTRFEEPAIPAVPAVPAAPAIPPAPGIPAVTPAPAVAAPAIPTLPPPDAKNTPIPAAPPPPKGPAKVEVPAFPTPPAVPGGVTLPQVGELPPAKPVEKPTELPGGGVKLPPATPAPLPVPSTPATPLPTPVMPLPVPVVPVKPLEAAPASVTAPKPELGGFQMQEPPKPEPVKPEPAATRLPVVPLNPVAVPNDPPPERKPAANGFLTPEVKPPSPPSGFTLPPPANPQPPAAGPAPAPAPAFQSASSAPAPASPPPPPAKGPVRTDIVVDIAAARPGQTYESLSRDHYKTAQYADELRRYNRDRDPARDEIELPPTSALRGPAPVVPAGGTTWAPAERPGADARPATGTRSYSVPQDGTTFRDLAETLLGRRDRYKQISDLNPARDPNEALKKGDAVVVPDSAEVRGRDRR